MSKLSLNALGAAAAAALLGGVALPAGASEYARVVSATPVVVPVAGVPQRECVEDARVVQRAPSGAGALLGAIVGGVVGNQIGGGSGRAIATGIGAVVGAGTGNHIEATSNGYATVPSTRCRTVATSGGSRVIGYDVEYEYHGQRYHARTASDPGDRIAIDVRPADGYRSAPPPAAYAPVPSPGGWQPVPRAVPAPVAPVAPVTYVETVPQVVYTTPAPVTYHEPSYDYLWPAAVGTAIGVGIGYTAGRHWDRGRWHGPRHHHHGRRAWR